MLEAAAFWLYAIGVTTIVETIVWKVLVRRDWTTLFVPALAVNAATVPLANFSYEWGVGRFRIEPLVFAAVESGVILTEILLIRGVLVLPWRLSAVVALAANLASSALSSR